jgi:hypothetical protein
MIELDFEVDIEPSHLDSTRLLPEGDVVIKCYCCNLQSLARVESGNVFCSMRAPVRAHVCV